MLNEKESEVHPMLSIVHRGEHRYDIFENDRDIGSVSVSRSTNEERIQVDNGLLLSATYCCIICADHSDYLVVYLMLKIS